MSLLGTTRADGNKEMVGSNKSSLLSGFYQGQEAEQFSMLAAMLVDARSLDSCHRTCDLYRCSPGTMLEGMRNHDGATTMLTKRSQSAAMAMNVPKRFVLRTPKHLIG